MKALRARAALLTVFVAVLPAGCGGLFHSNQRPEQTYYLRLAPAAVPAGAPAAAATGGASLLLLRPLPAPGLDSPHITLVQPDRRMDVYADSRWAAPTPDVVEALALQALRASGQWQAVEGSGSAFPARYLLQISLRRFEADYTSGGEAPRVEVVLDCTLGRRANRDTLAAFVAQGSAQAAANRMRDVVAAFEDAANQALAALVRQAAAAAQAQKEDSPVSSMAR
ncbi:MAG: membrane integrity-associated transporter subunit PqiC [Proteobacteria bacterium]|nr:membrane integrity-associated transporter subunit PqiC [Pseudomonadota bacterium]